MELNLLTGSLQMALLSKLEASLLQQQLLWKNVVTILHFLFCHICLLLIHRL